MKFNKKNLEIVANLLVAYASKEYTISEVADAVGLQPNTIRDSKTIDCLPS